MAQWWREQKDEVARAIDAAEEKYGHQIVVHVGNLGRHPERMATRLAQRWSSASLVFCVDPKHRHFEVRWSQHLTLDQSDVTSAVTEPLRSHDLAQAITALAALLPIQEQGDELPDIVTDDGN